MPVLTNIGCLLTCREAGGQGELHPVREAAIAWEGNTLVWLGRESEMPSIYRDYERLDAAGRLVAPGLIDCHTHLAFGGWRHDEFALRALGASYQEIALAGGGIASTVRATRAASREELIEKARPMLAGMMRLGITTVECKSGYGLTLADELKLLEVYQALAELQPVRIVPTLLAAHIVPEEYRQNRAEYVRMIGEEIIPAAAELARFCDVFVEEGAFTLDEARAILKAGKRFGLKPKLHVDQLMDGGGAGLAAEVGAVSADHLEHVSAAGIEALAAAGVIAVSLPFATFNLRQPGMPARACIEAGVPVAVATDFNPGSAPGYHLPFALYLACILQRMTPDEALKGATIYAARAIDQEEVLGSLEIRKRADLILVDASDANSWLAHLRANAVIMTVIDGEVVWHE